MSLGIVFKGPEGVVIAADSRVTLNTQISQPNGQGLILPSTFDNATKLLQVNGQDFVGVVTFGLGAIGGKEPRTAHSFIPEFEANINKTHNTKRLTVKEFAKELSNFFMGQWVSHNMPVPNDYKGDPIIFFVAGYDEGDPYGRVYEVVIPNIPQPTEKIAGEFGAIWGGQKEFVDRLINGYDGRLSSIAKTQFNLNDTQIQNFVVECAKNVSIKIPFQFLPLQDCVDLSIFLIRATINLQQWTIGIRGVGGAIDVATITKTDGFKAIQQKRITGEKYEI